MDVQNGFSKIVGFLVIAGSLLTASCARAPLLLPEEALRLTGDRPRLADDLPIEPFIEAVKHQIAFLQSEKGAEIKEFRFGARAYPKEEYLLGLEHLLELNAEARSKEHFLEKLERDFDFYEVYGEESWGDV